MEKIALTTVFLLLFSFASSNNTIVANENNVLYVGGSGPNNYTKIQDAINDTKDGYIIYVYPGYYNESIVINKSISLIGIGEEKPVIDGKGNRSAVKIIADGCLLKNFEIVNHGNFGEDKPGFAIEIRNANNNVIANNTIICNFTPFFMRNSSFNLISGNKITGGNWVGLHLFLNCYNNTIIYNNISYNPYAIGIELSSSNNTVLWNTITHNFHGIDVYADNNNISYNIVSNNKQYGVSIGPGSNNIILHNDICYNGKVGLLIACVSEPATNNVISYNNISSNGLRGIYLLGNWPYLSNNIIFRNIISYNGGKGIYLYWMCKNNVIQENNFIDNTGGNAGFHLFDRSYRNTWLRNYWSDWRLPLPKPIFGSVEETKIIIHYWLNFDWNPALEPWKI